MRILFSAKHFILRNLVGGNAIYVGRLFHCGCVASKSLCEYMDFGGIACKSCSKRLEQSVQIPSNIPNGTFARKGIRDVHPMLIENRIDGDKYSAERLVQLTKNIPDPDAASAELHKQIDPVLKAGESDKCLPNLSQQCSTSLAVVKAENSKLKQVVRNVCAPLPHPSLKFSLTTPLGSSSTEPNFPSGIVERSEQSKRSIQHGQKIRNNYLKPPKRSPVAGLETSKGYGSQTCIARPPAEGRGRNQLLPRYWPRITDQEFQQLSGDLKSNIVPFFEKFLSDSDAGRIGRLVLPKACAEAYFLTINQSEGIPIRIQDMNGKEWTFQFRFWANNNSRMYVLEGVTPCITGLELQAGDTVIFCRRDPGGQLVIGGRKASLVEVKDCQVTAIPSGVLLDTENFLLVLIIYWRMDAQHLMIP